MRAQVIEEGFAFLDGIDLFAPFQNQGYGGVVLALAEEHLAAQGIRSMSLHVFGTNQRALRFYQRHGYKITGYNRDYSDLLPPGAAKSNSPLWKLNRNKV